MLVLTVVEFLTEVRLDFELSVGSSDNLFPGNRSKDLYEIWHEVRHR